LPQEHGIVWKFDQFMFDYFLVFVTFTLQTFTQTFTQRSFIYSK